MAEAASKLWIPWLLLILLLIFCGWLYRQQAGLDDRVTKVEECCAQVEDCCDGGPGRKPIIVLDPPSSGTLTANWSVDGTPLSSPAQWGNSGELTEGAFGEVGLFGVTDTAGGGEVVASSMTLVLVDSGGKSHTLLVERTPTNQLSWTLDTHALLACDTTSGNGVPDCKTGSFGVPPELNGTITSLTTVPATSTPGAGVVTTVDKVRIQAK